MGRFAASLAAPAPGLDRPAYRPLLAVLLTAALLAGCGDRKPATKGPPPPPKVEVVTLRAQTVPVVREYVGTVTAYRSVEVRARVEGILEKRFFTEGKPVKKGELLYRIDPAQYEAALRDAQAELAKAEANVANAKAKEARLAPLVKEDAISQQEYDDAVSSLKQGQAAVLSARAQLDRAKLNLDYTNVYATESGVIGLTQVPEGRLVGKGEPTLLATIERIQPIYVTFTLPDRDALALKKALARGEIKEQSGEQAQFILPDGTPYTQAGKIDFADPQINRETGTVTLRAVLPNTADPQLAPGLYVKVELTAGQRPNAIVVPQRAVVKMPNGQIAWVVTADNKVERRDLVLGDWYNDQWVVEKGLAAGDRVIVEGVQRVQPGMTVQPVDFVPPAARPAPAPVTPAATSSKT
ncbi:MAG TPA: efflux RND transporter periplasmic adaptor subunit [Burkholderiaceae bacterium]|nr:efflux RND transporter periplasmic adaptor subunit [Burkholderiaceae bacterium]